MRLHPLAKLGITLLGLYFLTTAVLGLATFANPQREHLAVAWQVLLILGPGVPLLLGLGLIGGAPWLATLLAGEDELVIDATAEVPPLDHLLPTAVVVAGVFLTYRAVPGLVYFIGWSFDQGAQDVTSAGGESLLGGHWPSLVYHLAHVAIALFVLLRADLLASWILRLRDRHHARP